MSPTTSNETSSPVLPRYSLSLNDSSAPSSPVMSDRSKAFDELTALQSSSDPTFTLLGKLERNSRVQQNISSPKVKRSKSAFFDEEAGVQRCRNCDWIYPNPNPSARTRRDHKKHCGKIRNVQQWLKIIDPGDQDIQGPIEEGEEEGQRPVILKVDMEIGKAPITSDQEQEETLYSVSLDPRRGSSSADTKAPKLTDDAERVMEAEDEDRETFDFANVAVAKVTDSPGNDGEATESYSNGEHVSKSYAESGEGNSQRIESSYNPLVVDGSDEDADNDAEGQETHADDDNVISGNGDFVHVEDEEQGYVEEMQEPKDDRESYVKANSSEARELTSSNEQRTEKDHLDFLTDRPEDPEEQMSAGGANDIEALRRGEYQGEAQGILDPSIEFPGLDSDANSVEMTVKVDENDIGDGGQEDRSSDQPVENITLENSGGTEDAERVERNGETKEELDIENLVPAADQDGADSAIGGVDLEDGKSDGGEKVISRTDREIQDGEDSCSPMASTNPGNGELANSSSSKPDNVMESTDHSEFVKPEITVPCTDEDTDDNLFPVSVSSLQRFGTPRSILGGKKSESSSSSSSRSSSGGDDSDNDRGTPRKTSQDGGIPVSGFRQSDFSVEVGSPDAGVSRHSSVEENASASPWRSRNAIQDELLEGLTYDPAPLRIRTRVEISVPETAEDILTVITPTTTGTTTVHSPEGTPGTNTSTVHQVAVVSSAIKEVDFKARQMYWAEITSSDVLEGHKPTTSRSSFESKRPPLLKHKLEFVDDMQSPSPSDTITDHSREVSKDGELEVAVSESSSSSPHPVAVTSSPNSHPASVASSSSPHPVAVASYSISHPVFVASSSNSHPVSVASSSNSQPVVEYDIERVVHDQKTHDIMCPVCGSCITKRVILRKRKKTEILKYDPKWEEHEPASPIAEPLVQRELELEPERDSWGWGCLSCFSVFFPGSDVEPRERTPCLEIICPRFPWRTKSVPVEEPRRNYNVDDPALVEPLLPKRDIAEPAPPAKREDEKESVSCFDYLRKSKSSPVPKKPPQEVIPEVPVPPVDNVEQPASTGYEDDASALQGNVEKLPFSTGEITSPASEGPYKLSMPQEPKDLFEEPKVEPSPPVVSTPKVDIAVKAKITPVEDGTKLYVEAEIQQEVVQPTAPQVNMDLDVASESKALTDSAEQPVLESVMSGYVDQPDLFSIPKAPNVLPSDERINCLPTLPRFFWGSPTTEGKPPVIENLLPSPASVIPSESKDLTEEKKLVSEPEVTYKDSGTPSDGVLSRPEESSPPEPTPSHNEGVQTPKLLEAAQPLLPAKEDSRCLPLKFPKFHRKPSVTPIESDPTISVDKQPLKTRPEEPLPPVETPATDDDAQAPQSSGAAQLIPADKEASRCLPLFSIGKRSSTPIEPKPTIVVDKQPWKSILYPDLNTLHYLSIRADLFDVEIPRDVKSPTVLPATTEYPGPETGLPSEDSPPRKIHYVPVEVDSDKEIVDIGEPLPTVVLPDSEAHAVALPFVEHKDGLATNLTTPLLPSSPKGPSAPELGPKQAAESTSCCTVIDILLPSFKWGRKPVETPQIEPVDDLPQPSQDFADTQSEAGPSEENPVPISVPPAAEDAISAAPSTSYSSEGTKREPEITPKDEYSSYKREVNRVVGHVVNFVTIVNVKNNIEQSIEVQKNVTHFETQFDANNHIVSSEELRAEDLQQPSKVIKDEEEVAVDDETQADPPLIRKKQEVKSKTKATVIAEVLLSEAATRDKPDHHVDTPIQVPKRRDREQSCSCLPFVLPKLSLSWKGKDDLGESDELTRPLLRQQQQVQQPPGTGQQQTLGQRHESIVDIPPTHAADLATTPLIPGRSAPAVAQGYEVVKSIVYGGLDITLISLGVVASSTGADAKTRTVIVMGLANIVFGFITFLGTIASLYRSDREQFKELVGPSFGFNGFLAGFSYLFFGLLSPITYGFTFRHETNRDFKMGATCLVALVCIILLGWGKARVTSQSAFKLISTLITTGFVGAIACYQAGDYVSLILEKIGFDSV
ncbi:hypothetical protein Mapa_015551 [Marchantia paleacea]|nr:hypothetical protein Mapa_015551 [Marchantia paleacea]